MVCFKCGKSGYNFAVTKDKRRVCSGCDVLGESTRDITITSSLPAGSLGQPSLPNLVSKQEWAEIAKLCKEISKK